MEINKQLFEDVLSGKLKGIFILRNGDKYDSSKLYRNANTNKMKSQDYPYALYVGNYVFSYYIPNGKNGTLQVNEYDIIDFIPDTDMKENELTIEIPDGKIVDWDESKKQNKIVLKDKQLTYGDICEKLFKNCLYFINERGKIELNDNVNKWMKYDANNADSKHQLECILAKNKLANVAKYLNGEWNIDSHSSFGYIIIDGGYTEFKIEYTAVYSIESSGRIVFKTKEFAQHAIEILGEETVKLALEPLGI